ncbi:MAG: hypothetical protein HUU10_07680 [Bacteroidetes bacterium]|nr:hypothetical protein [Bacteroidota bacterium]
MKTLLSLSLILATSTLFAQEPTPSETLLLKKSRWVWGAGLAVSSLPVADADFKMVLSDLHYEYVFTEMKPILGMKPGLNVGVIGLNGFIPLPMMELTGTINYGEGLAGRFGVGGFYDVLIAGHSGLTLKAGVLFDDKYEFAVMSVPVGGQPVKPYSEFIENGPDIVKLPYFALMITFR